MIGTPTKTTLPPIKATIMVIEDDPLQLKFISMALRMLGYVVVEARDGVQALQELDKTAPDLIISDINMPDINGLELLKALRANPETESIPFILVTANNAADDIAAAFNMGADDYLTKPFSVVELQARVTAKINRPPLPAHQLQWDRHSGLPSESALLDDVKREAARAEDAQGKGYLACVGVREHNMLDERFGERIYAPIVKQMIALAEYDRLPLEIMGTDSENDLLILIPEASNAMVKERLSRFSRRMAQHRFVIGAQSIRLNPIVGLVSVEDHISPEQLLEQAKTASMFARLRADLEVAEYAPSMDTLAQERQTRTQTARSINLWTLLTARWRSMFQNVSLKATGSHHPAASAAHLPNTNITGKQVTSTQEQIKATIMVVEDDPVQRKLISTALRMLGHVVVEVKDGVEALQQLDETAPDLIISDINMPDINGLELLKALRANPETESIPFILATARNTADDIAAGFNLGADDYLTKPISLIELQARVTAKIERPSVPASQLHWDRHTGLLNKGAFLDEVKREVARANQAQEKGRLVCVSVSERELVNERFGGRSDAPIIKQMIALAEDDRLPLEIMGGDAENDLLMLIPEAASAPVKKRLRRFARRIARHTFVVGEENVRLTPIIGFVAVEGHVAAEQLLEQAKAAALFAGLHLDLEPVEYAPSMDALAHERKAKTQTVKKISVWSRQLANWRTGFQIGMTILLGVVLPFVIYAILGSIGFDITQEVYVVVVLGLLLTSALIWWEGILALRRVDPPEAPGTHYPVASAIIAAYLPNEAATIEATIDAFLRVDYPGPLQIILAYNTPRDMPIEKVFKEIADRDGRFVPFRVKDSTSKAQNVNAALSLVEGKFVGVFDADHQPDPDSFSRAWRWLSNGYDVVQGHCLVRNGDASWVARTVAVEFEAIYAVSHPGRSRLHNFGIFGGSNGYWKTDLLRETRMHGFMLTEDIDSSFRVISNGHKIINDPYLISRELATTRLQAVWNQRMRWAQGWFQVTLVQAPRLLRSKRLTVRQKLGVFHLLVWREIYPWLSWQMIPIVVYWAWKLGGVDKIDWSIPIFVVTTILTMSTGPLQLLFVRRLADESIRKRRRWLWWYVFAAAFAYVEYKNLIARVAQIKEIMGERAWKVTARS